MRISLASKELHQRCWDHLGIWQPPGDLSWTMWRLPWLLLSQGMSGGLGLGIQSCSDWWEVDDLTNSKLLSYHLSVGYSTCNIKKKPGLIFTCWLWGKTGFFTCPWHCWPCPSQFVHPSDLQDVGSRASRNCDDFGPFRGTGSCALTRKPATSWGICGL